MRYWAKQFEAYIANWPSLASQYKSLPEWSKRDCANAMKLWVELGHVKTTRSIKEKNNVAIPTIPQPEGRGQQIPEVQP